MLMVPCLIITLWALTPAFAFFGIFFYAVFKGFQ